MVKDTNKKGLDKENNKHHFNKGSSKFDNG